ncbi:MAG: ankyrin repeat domain-containing protein [Alphaproteobacteria bacterium]|nr:ankyrin repeat domain-containing protein [Alphaproteobacteria bacterium]
MNIKKYIPFIIILTIIIMVSMMLVLSNKNNNNHTATEISSVEEILIAEKTPAEEIIVVEETPDEEIIVAEEIIIAEERFTAEEKLDIRKILSQIETLPSELTTTELRLFGYYAIFKNSDVLDVLTENDVQAIIDELKQFQPEDIKKLVHHADDIVKYASNIELKARSFSTDEYGYVEHNYLSYPADNGWYYKILISPTIDEILLRAATEHPEMDIYYETQFATNPLFMQLADTNNNNIIPLLQLFLDNGADINAKNPTWGKTIFSYVGTLEIAQLLLANGADPTIIANNGESPLIHAIYWHRSHQLIKFLIDIGVDLHAKSSSDNTALSEARRNFEYFNSGYENTESDDELYLASEIAAFPAQLANAEEVVRIIEQALEAEKKP